MSQRRKNKIANGEGVDLSEQDAPLERDSWVPASQHGEYENEEEDEDDVRGRQEQATAA